MKLHQGFFVLVLAVLSSAALAKPQRFTVKDGDTIRVMISANELTRFVIEGEGRFDKMWGVQGSFEVEQDRTNGEVTIRPTQSADKGQQAASFFLRDDLGNVYTVVTEQYDIPSQTVYLKPRYLNRRRSGETTSGDSEAYVKQIKQLVRALALKEDLPNYDQEDMGLDVPLWKETRIVLTHRLIGPQLVGEYYLLSNTSKEEIVLSEEEFNNFGSDVRAVAIDRKVLKPSEVTAVYVVRKGGE